MPHGPEVPLERGAFVLHLHEGLKLSNDLKNLAMVYCFWLILGSKRCKLVLEEGTILTKSTIKGNTRV